MKNITILGENVKLSFSLAAQICYERITDKAFDLADLSKTENRLALFFSVISTSNPESKITFEMLVTELTFEELKTLTTAVDDVISEWYNIPKPANMEEQADEEPPKND